MKIKIGDTFTIGGHDYDVLSPDEAMTLERYKAFEWLKMENQFQASVISIADPSAILFSKAFASAILSAMDMTDA